MTIQTVGLLSPGDMGNSVGRVLVDHGMKVLEEEERRSSTPPARTWKTLTACLSTGWTCAGSAMRSAGRRD